MNLSTFDYGHNERMIREAEKRIVTIYPNPVADYVDEVFELMTRSRPPVFDYATISETIEGRAPAKDPDGPAPSFVSKLAAVAGTTRPSPVSFSPFLMTTYVMEESELSLARFERDLVTLRAERLRRAAEEVDRRIFEAYVGQCLEPQMTKFAELFRDSFERAHTPIVSRPLDHPRPATFISCVRHRGIPWESRRHDHGDGCQTIELPDSERR